MKTIRKLFFALMATCLLSSVALAQTVTLTSEQRTAIRAGGAQGKAAVLAALAAAGVNINNPAAVQAAVASLVNELSSEGGTAISPDLIQSVTATVTEAIVESVTQNNGDSATIAQAAAAGAASGAVQAASAAGTDVAAAAQAAAAGAATGAVHAVTNTNASAEVIASVARAAATGSAQGAADAGLSTQAINAVVLSAATSATQAAADAGVAVTISEVSVQAPTTPETPGVTETPQNEAPPTDNIVQTFNFTIMTINVAGQNVALSLTSAITDAVAVVLTGNTVVGTQITSANNTFDLAAIATAALGSGASLTSAQLQYLAGIIADALNVPVIASGSSSIIVSPSS